jgi:hypothetical protein
MPNGIMEFTEFSTAQHGFFRINAKKNGTFCMERGKNMTFLFVICANYTTFAQKLELPTTRKRE